MEELKHSGLGIASFIVSIAAGVCIFFTFVIAGAIEATTPGGMNEESVTAIIIGLLLVIFLFATLVSLGLGIGGLFQKERKKIFATRIVKPEALWETVVEIDERVLADGTVETPLDEAAVRAALETLRADGFEALAIVFLHAWAFPAHEAAVGRIAKSLCDFSCQSTSL